MKSFVILAGCAAMLTGCGAASVVYAPPSVTSNDPNYIKNILEAASKGNQTLALPYSRLVVQVKAASGGGDQPAASPTADAAQPPSLHPIAGAPPAHAPRVGGVTPMAAGAVQRGEGGAASPSGGQPAPKEATITPNPNAGVAPANGAGNAADKTTATPVTVALQDGAGNTYSVNVTMVESPVVFSVKSNNDFFSKNDFGVTRLANTRVPTTVSNTFTDQTAARVQSVAGIVGALVKGGLPQAETASQPSKKACVSGELTVSGAGPWMTATDACLMIKITRNATGSNLIPISAFTAALADSKSQDWTRVWPVPACMTVTITIGLSQSSMATGQMTVIDPEYVEVMPIPKKGKISMHPICGADFADSSTDKYQAVFDTISAITNALPQNSSSTKK